MVTAGVSVKSSGVPIPFGVAATVEFWVTASVVPAPVGSVAAAPPGVGVAELKTSPVEVLTLTVELKVDSVTAFVSRRHKKINI